MILHMLSLLLAYSFIIANMCQTCVMLCLLLVQYSICYAQLKACHSEHTFNIPHFGQNIENICKCLKQEDSQRCRSTLLPHFKYAGVAATMTKF